MPRRSPPTPLRLHVGPLPPRSVPKHTMPSLPRPAFHGAAPTINTTTGAIPRPRMTHIELPSLVIPEPAAPSTALTAASLETQAWSGPSSPTSAESTRSTTRKKSREFTRGPWDHSGAIHVPFDVGAVLPPPMPAAINAAGESKGVGARRPWV
ncbi:hypothetical protein GSI_13493 [Ganoderma sinense ZZ0214-1]|uniref:Uncharacterized protein n=1 Tax=Ganoderma sinense ZZ0214-1 TaxID=1077348 RepID=A0A2G8RQG0_9APHY|nr:hypothetical protein GSI_13493 [Ganoderma sinense ZZ0214-1]